MTQDEADQIFKNYGVIIPSIAITESEPIISTNNSIKQPETIINESGIKEVVTPEETKVATPDLSEPPTIADLTLLGTIDLPTIDFSGLNKTANVIKQQEAAKIVEIVNNTVPLDVKLAAESGTDPAATQAYVAALTNEIETNESLTPEQAHTLSQGALIAAGNLHNEAIKSSDSEIINTDKVITDIALQSIVNSAAVNENAANEALANSQNAEEYKTNLEALKAAQVATNNADNLINLQAQKDPAILEKANAIIADLKEVIVSVETVEATKNKQDILGKLIDFIYNKLYKD